MMLHRNDLMSGDILHCTSCRWSAKFIKFFTGSRINHTALVIEVWDELFIIDSHEDGTNLRPIAEWNRKNKYDYKIHRPAEFSVERRKRAVSKLGSTPFDFASLLLWQPLYLISGKWYGRRQEDAACRMYCSEYIAWVYELDKWWKVTPQIVYETMCEDDFFSAV